MSSAGDLARSPGTPPAGPAAAPRCAGDGGRCAEATGPWQGRGDRATLRPASAGPNPRHGRSRCEPGEAEPCDMSGDFVLSWSVTSREKKGEKGGGGGGTRPRSGFHASVRLHFSPVKKQTKLYLGGKFSFALRMCERQVLEAAGASDSATPWGRRGRRGRGVGGPRSQRGPSGPPAG